MLRSLVQCPECGVTVQGDRLGSTIGCSFCGATLELMSGVSGFPMARLVARGKDVPVLYPNAPVAHYERSYGRELAPYQHLLDRCATERDQMATIYTRLAHVSEAEDGLASLRDMLERPSIVPWLSLPDRADPRLVRTYGGQSGEVNTCAFGPDGTFFVSGGRDRVVRIWDTDSGRVLHTIHDHQADGLPIGSRGITRCLMSPAADYIVTMTERAVRLWHWPGLAPLLRVEIPDGSPLPGPFIHCAISRDGRRLAAGLRTHVCVWDLTTLETIFAERVTEYRTCETVFCPSGEWIVTLGWQEEGKIWNLELRQEMRTVGHWWDSSANAEMSPDGDGLYIPGSVLRKWHVEKNEVCTEYRPGTDDIRWCSLTPDGSRIVAALSSTHHSLIGWDTASGEEWFRLYGHSECVNSCAVHPSGQMVLSAGADGTLRLWNPAIESTMLHHEPDYFRQDSDPEVNKCTVSPEGDVALILAQRDVHAIDVQKNALAIELQELNAYHHSRYATDIAYSADGDVVAIAEYPPGPGGALVLFDAHTGKRIRSIATAQRALSCSVSSDGRAVAGCLNGGVVGVWDVATGAVLHLLRAQGIAEYCTFATGARHLVSALRNGSDSYAIVWDLESETETLRAELGYHLGSPSYELSPSEDWLACYGGRTLRTVCMKTGKTLREHEDAGGSSRPACCVSPDGRWIATVSWEEQSLSLWDSSTLARVAMFQADGGLNDCAFFADGERLMAVGRRGIYWLQILS